MFGIKDYIIATMAVALLGGSGYNWYKQVGYDKTISEYKINLVQSQHEVGTLLASKAVLKETIKKRNAAIKHNTIDKKKRIADINKWKASSDKYKYSFASRVDDINVTRGNCADNEILNDSLDGFDLNGMW